MGLGWGDTRAQLRSAALSSLTAQAPSSSPGRGCTVGIAIPALLQASQHICCGTRGACRGHAGTMGKGEK